MINERAVRFGGATMIIAALASVLAVMHHPAIRARSGHAVFVAIGHISSTDQTMHAAVIEFTIALVFALCVLSLRLLMQPPAIAALICYSFGAIAWVGAALLDGFFTPTIAARYIDAPATAVSSGLALLQFCAIGIQIFTKFGIATTGVAILLWSAVLVRLGRPAMVAAGVGIVAVLIEAYVAIFTGPIITARTIPYVVAAQTMWYVVVGMWMMGGLIDPS